MSTSEASDNLFFEVQVLFLSLKFLVPCHLILAHRIQYDKQQIVFMALKFYIKKGFVQLRGKVQSTGKRGNN